MVTGWDKSDPQFGRSTALIGLDLVAAGPVTGAQMKRSPAAIVLLAIAIGLATVSAHAQGMGGMGGGMGGGGHKHQQKTDKTDPQKPKADDKAYNAAQKLTRQTV